MEAGKTPYDLPWRTSSRAGTHTHTHKQTTRIQSCMYVRTDVHGLVCSHKTTRGRSSAHTHEHICIHPNRGEPVKSANIGEVDESEFEATGMDTHACLHLAAHIHACMHTAPEPTNTNRREHKDTNTRTHEHNEHNKHTNTRTLPTAVWPLRW